MKKFTLIFLIVFGLFVFSITQASAGYRIVWSGNSSGGPVPTSGSIPTNETSRTQQATYEAYMAILSNSNGLCNLYQEPSWSGSCYYRSYYEDYGFYYISCSSSACLDGTWGFSNENSGAGPQCYTSPTGPCKAGNGTWDVVYDTTTTTTQPLLTTTVPTTTTTVPQTTTTTIMLAISCKQLVGAGGNYTVGLKENGSVVAVGSNYGGQCNVSDWNNIVQVAAGGSHTVGLKADGSVVAVGYNTYGQCNVSGWSNIVQVAAGYEHTVGLKVDGSVVAVGNDNSGQCNVSGWTGIVQVAAGGSHTVGLKADGSVVAVGYNTYGQCNVSGWSNIVQVEAGGDHTVGLKAEGSVVAEGYNYFGQCNVSLWNLSCGVPPTLINLSSFTATPKFSKVIIEWTTESEIDNAGFNIYRADLEDGEYIKINDSLILLEGSPTQGASYEFTDTDAQNRKTYYYKLEDIDLNGQSTMHGPVSATPRWFLSIFGIFKK